MAVLIDTNVLVYALDTSEREKCRCARETLRRLAASGVGSVSSQVLGEHYSVVRWKFAHVMDADGAVRATQKWAAAFSVHETTLGVVLEALRGTIRHQLPYYDAQIWAVARLNQISLVLSEDFADGSVVEGVRFANPFGEGFELEALLS